jgi:hypothetical protein
MNLPETLEIKPLRAGKGLIAKINLNGGTAIFNFIGRLGNDKETNIMSLQIDDNLFLESTMGYDDFLNHSCNPNCYIDFNGIRLTALRPIKAGEELTYNYNTTEYDLVNSEAPSFFKCSCDSKDCYEIIKGFKYLKQKEKIKPFLSPFLKKKFSS